MKHFDITAWANFVRNVEMGTNRAAMVQHLSSGCSVCQRMVAALEQTAAFAKQDESFEPPARIVSRSELIIASPARTRLRDRLVPRLIFDSAHEPTPVGFRGAPTATRQVMYQAGDFYVDLRLDRAPHGRKVRLLGQVANRRKVADPFDAGTVLLKSGKRIVRRAAPNQFQEFQMEYEPQVGLRLQIPIPGVPNPLEISLENLASPVHGRKATGRYRDEARRKKSRVRVTKAKRR